MEHLGEVQRNHGEIEAAGAAVLAVSFAAPEMAAEYAADHRLPFPLASDTEHAAYRAFGLARGERGRVFRPSAILQHVALRLRGFTPGRHRQDDIYQLGGDFVLDRAGNIALAHPSVAGDDRPAMADLLRAVRAVRSSPATPITR